MNILLCLFIIADVQIPQPLPKGPPVINSKAIDGHYIIKGSNYTSTAYIKQPSEVNIYLVYQYAGNTVSRGIGFMDGDRFIIGWEQEKAVGATSIQFRDGKGRASWVSNPGSGKVEHETWRLIDAEN